jgi:hypothetical protein
MDHDFGTLLYGFGSEGQISYRSGSLIIPVDAFIGHRYVHYSAK